MNIDYGTDAPSSRLSFGTVAPWLAFIPSNDEQPLIWLASVGHSGVNHSLPLPSRGEDIMLTADPGLSPRRRSIGDHEEQGLCLGRVVVRVSVAAEINGMTGYDQLIEPLQSPPMSLPHRKPRLFYCDPIGPIRDHLQ